MIKQIIASLKKDMKSKDWIVLTALIIGAILIRLLLLSRQFAVGFDQVNYIKLAASAHMNGFGDVLHTYWTPLYPFMVSLFSFIIPDYIIAAYTTSLAFSVLIIPVIYFFVKHIYNKSAAIWAGFYAAFFTFFVFNSVQIATEAVYTFVAVLGIITSWFALRKTSLSMSIVSGLCFGAAYLARPEGVGFLLVFLGAGFITIIYKILKKQRFVELIVLLFLTAILAGGVASPYLLFLKSQTGEWTISIKGKTNQLGEQALKDLKEGEEHPFHVLSDDNMHLGEDETYHLGTFVQNYNKDKIFEQKSVSISPATIIAKYIENFYRLMTESLTMVLTVPLLLLLGLGLLSPSKKTDRSLIDLYLFLYVAFFWFLVIPMFHITLRYLVPLLPIVFVWVGLGTQHLLESTQKLKAKIAPKIPSILVSFIVIVLIFGTSSLLELAKQIKKNQYSVEEWDPAIEQKKAGLWLKENGGEGAVVMAKNHAIGLYAGNYNIYESVEIPANTIDRTIEYARYRQVKYIAFDERYKRHFPQLEHLLYKKDIPNYLKLVYENQLPNGLRTVIYEIIENVEHE